MTPEEYQWYIKLVQDRYFALSLSFEQAEQVYQYEQDKDFYSVKHYFSVWEEWDFELASFRNILTGEQLKGYEESLRERIAGYTTGLVEHDAKKLNDTKYYEELSKFYKEQFLPDIHKESYLLNTAIIKDQVKVDYLRAEYSRFLQETRKEILVTHFRFNRTFMPNELASSLMRHQLYYLWPNGDYFKQKGDEPTKAVITFLEDQYFYFAKKMELLFKKKYEERSQFMDIAFKKYHTESGGWSFVMEYNKTAEEEARENLLCLLLMNKQYPAQ